MATIAENLNKLLNIKGAIKEALFFVGQEVADKMEDWAMAIRNICNVPFENLGYDEEDATFYKNWIRDAYANGKKIKDNASTLESLKLYLDGGTTLGLSWNDPIFFPNTAFPNCWYINLTGNTNVLTIPTILWEIHPQGNQPALNNLGTTLAKIIRFKNDIFTYYPNFPEYVESIHLNFINIISGASIISEANAVSRRRLIDLRIDNLGTQPEHESFAVRSDILGINTKYYPNARANLIYTLLESSFDRASAGYSVFTIALTQATFNLLTEEEITAITAKGFTITVA